MNYMIIIVESKKYYIFKIRERGLDSIYLFIV